MNWYRTVMAKWDFETLDDAFQAVRRSLNALKYREQPIDPLGVDFNQLSEILAETGTIPAGVDPHRYAAMVVWYAKNPEEARSL